MTTTITRWTGFDSSNKPVVLGGTDSDGKRVGFIDADGLCWESVRERDLLLTSARYNDALIERKRNPNAPPAVVGYIARVTCLDKNNRGDAIKYALAMNDPNAPVNRAIAAYVATRK